MSRVFFIVGALYDFEWVAILLLMPGTILRKMPPSLAIQIVWLPPLVSICRRSA